MNPDGIADDEWVFPRKRQKMPLRNLEKLRRNLIHWRRV